ncbi:MAG TPA: PDZ domain-containing protein [Leucothrix mucor]|nr:PDZ domain-containing protein [Leucothrix mucor]
MKKILISTILLSLSACSTHNIVSNPAPQANNTQSTSSQRPVNVIALKDSRPLQTIIPQLAKYKAVLVGESHTRYGDHLNQLAIIKGLHPHWKNMAIGLEFIQHPFQKALDDYIAGSISEEKMLRETQWYERWRYDFRLYRPIFDYAKQHQIPLIALNTPREITKRITKVGIKGLNKTERAQLPKVLDLSNIAYKKRLEKIYSQHAKTSSKKFTRFLEAQIAWDESMADQAAKYLQRHPKSHLVVLAGGGHLINRHGIPSRLERRIASKTAVVLNSTHITPKPSQGDYLLFSADTELPKAGKMGIFMKDTDKGVVISKISKTSASDKAGLKKADNITAINSQVISNIQDVKIIMMDKKPKETVILDILRSGKYKLSKKLSLQ